MHHDAPSESLASRTLMLRDTIVTIKQLLLIVIGSIADNLAIFKC